MTVRVTERARQDDRIVISHLEHKASKAVDEEGTEAAAANAVGFDKATTVPSPPRIFFTVNRPFLYLIAAATFAFSLQLSRADTCGRLENWLIQYNAGHRLSALREIASYCGLDYFIDWHGPEMADVLLDASRRGLPEDLIKKALQRYRCLPDLYDLDTIERIKALADELGARCPASALIARVNQEGLPLRNAPRQKAKIIGVLEKYLVVDVLDRGKVWTEIRAWNGATGYVRTAKIEPYKRPEILAYEDGGKYGYRNLAGEVVIEPRYIHALNFLETGIGAVVDDKGWAYIDISGKVVLRPVTVDNGPDYFKEGLARFFEDGKMGFFDRTGRIVVPARFEWIAPFSDGRARFCEGCAKKPEDEHGEHFRMTGKRWGYIDRTGRVIVKPH